eukprot:1891204-Pleurochrysis_carterae.AAC.1
MPFRRIAKPATGSTTRFASTEQMQRVASLCEGNDAIFRLMQRIRACRHEAERGAFKFRASGRASMPKKSARAALCCASNPLACRVIITRI